MVKEKPDARTKALRRELQAEARILKSEIAYVKKHLDKIWEHVSVTNDRLQNLEIQMNLVSRLVATLAVEKMNMRTFGLVKMIRRIEKQLIADDQVQDLENLYRLDHPKNRKQKGDFGKSQ